MAKKRGFLTQLVRHAGLRESFCGLPCHTYRGICAASGHNCRFPVCGALFLQVSVSLRGAVCHDFRKAAV